ncbi:hypothetical protein PV682_13120 [Streptomyces niveiscabiei]|uniref:hypothetical protein n=1 Tax=Streptomyces niveiscabiei TaxID=164115 RepID=UPI0029AEF492|nr:hypothetical protein [Streptomyces niveiscabiei]MDX3382396.1 hypothetical protein [Streptomyces niveiscabiei]
MTVLSEQADVFPKTTSGHLTTWVGVGGSPERFLSHIELYSRAAAEFGTTAHPVGMHPRLPRGHRRGGARAAPAALPGMRDRIGALRGRPPPWTSRRASSPWPRPAARWPCSAPGSPTASGPHAL